MLMQTKFSKRFTGGCAAFLVLGLTCCAAFMVAFFANRPGEANFIQSEEKSNFGPPTNARTSEEKDPAIRLHLDLQVLSQFELKSGSHGGSIEVSSTYDQNNFLLETLMDEDQSSYRLSFKSKKPAWVYNAIFTGFQYENQACLTLPTHLRYEIVIDVQVGNYTFDLSGLAVESLTLNSEKGHVTLLNSKPNPMAMSPLNLASEWSDIRVRDLQNYGFTDASFVGQYGKLSLQAGDDFLSENLNLNLDWEFGETTLFIPEKVNLRFEDPAAFGQKGHLYGQRPVTINLDGQMKFGQFNVHVGTSDP